MPPKTRREKHSIEAANIRWERNHVQSVNEYPEPHIITPQQAVMGALVSGTTYTSFSRGLAVANIVCGTKDNFYKEQPKLLDCIINESQKTMSEAIEEELNNNPDGSIVSFDARYSSRRKAVQCSTSFIGESGKVLHVEHAIENEPFRKGNYNGSSCNMESFTVVNGMQHLNEMLPLSGYVHDGDNKSPSRLKNAGIELEEHKDITHALKSIGNGITKASEKVKSITKKNMFYGLKTRLQFWARTIIQNVDDLDLRVHLWMNTPDHLVGNHEFCLHDELNFGNKTKFWVWKNGQTNQIAFQALCHFCELTLKYIIQINKNFGTQTNESVNSEMAHYAPKRVSLKSSYEGRIAFAIGMHNSPTFLYDVLVANKLSELIHPDLLNELKRNDIKNYEKRKIRNAFEERNKRRIERDLFRKKYSKKGDYHLSDNSDESSSSDE